VGQANAFLPVALAGFLVVALALFRSMPAPVAGLTAILVGELFLPSTGDIDLPGLPKLDKDLLIYLDVLVAMLLFARGRLLAARPGRSLELLGVAVAIGGIGTALTNADPLVYGPTVLAGMTIGEVPTAFVADLLSCAVPFLIGRALVRDSRDLARLLTALVLAGMAYSLLGWVEIRLSPQLHRWVYGVIPFGFATASRFGGYRPVVFLRSGLAYAIWIVTVFLAAITLWRARLPAWRVPAQAAVGYLSVVLVFTRSMASVVFGFATAPLLALLRPRMVARIAAVLALFVASYPLLRLGDWLPVDKITDAFASIDEERAKSLGGRFDVERAMAEKARERPVFGWGGSSRAWVFNENTGESKLIPDGYWVLSLGHRGVVGWASEFGLMIVPVWVATRRMRRVASRRDQILLAGLTLIVAMRLVDMIPNGRWTSLPIFLGGALHSCSAALSRRVVRPVRAVEAEPEPTPAPSLADRASAGTRQVTTPRRMSDTLRRRPDREDG